MDEPMNFAIIDDNGFVINIIWLNESNKSDFPDAVQANDLQVTIGDQYIDGVFTRDGIPVPTYEEIASSALVQDETPVE